ncbi:putative Sequence-specific DNA binding transcription factor [Hibiscus syriacus]|uniref:Sequence-specific DNA binding transcription factor n=1 Tax=Hibiscus syriacus TaxID=106335 RepID=A0A6A3A526_HIBSY|nr:putative Sequence-specific DNA binding transcription factor [Hibiscus syriacus]
MKSDRLLDYVVFQLSPKCSRCELFVSSNGSTEKLASVVKPFVTHLKVAEEQVALSLQSIKLEVEKHKNAKTWFVLFVSTPEVLELVNTFDAEMSQLEAARRIYFQGVGDQPSGEGKAGMIAAADATKKEVLRAINVRLIAIQQDLATAFARSSAAGFSPDTVLKLQQFADQFGAHRLNEACTKFISLCQRRQELIQSAVNDQVVRASWGSDMSINDPEEKEEEGVTESSPSQISQPARRLSVQDKINLFENKQKETSGSEKPIAVGKSVELRRLSSDVSSAPAAAEKAVLRRWSGASDMSIDLGNDKKDGNIDNPLCTPSSSLVFQGKNTAFQGLSDDKEQKDEKGLTDKVNDKEQKDEKGLTDKVSSIKAEPTSAPNKAADYVLKDQGEVQSQVGNLLGKEEGVRLKGWTSRKDQLGLQNIQYQSFTGKSEQVELGDQVVSQEKVNGSITGESGGLEVQSRILTTKAAIVGVVNQPTNQLQVVGGDATAEGQFEGGFGLTLNEAQYKGTEGGQFSQLQWKSFTGEVEEVGMKGLASSEKQMSKIEDSGVHKMKFKKQFPVDSEPSKKLQSSTNNKSVPGQKVPESAESLSSPMVPVDQTPRIRQTRGNQELNDELKMKANELEKLFAEHKLRVPGDQFSSARRINPADEHIEQEGSSQGEKEAKLKAIKDILEQSRTEMKAKFSGSDRQASMSSALREAKKGRSFNLQSQREQHPISSIQSEEDEDHSQFSDHQYYRQDRSYNEASLVKGSSRISNSKKVLPNRNVSLSTPRTTAVAVPRSAAKDSNPSSGRRRTQSENPLAQSVPTFSDLRKEKKKLSSGAGKMNNHFQVRKYARSKSNNEEISLGKDEQSRRSQSNKKSSGHLEFSDVPALNSDDIVLAPMKFNKKQTEQSFNDESLKNVKAKPFLQKGDDVGSGAGIYIANLRESEAPETPNGEEFDELAFEADDSMDISKADEGPELETMVDDSVDMENGKSRLSQESDKLDNFGSENGDSLRSLSQVDPTLVAELPAAMLTTFHTAVSLQESSRESPVSWNSGMHHLYSYPQETSEIDASMVSPIRSLDSWNPHSLSQTGADAARTRKKWGSAQKPFLVANANHNQPRKDVTKGFKRLLKFGRKGRGTDNLVDWISATTSEGDDDTEDGRDSASRSHEDLRKSRMGFSQGHPSL